MLNSIDIYLWHFLSNSILPQIIWFQLLIFLKLKVLFFDLYISSLAGDALKKFGYSFNKTILQYMSN